MRGDAFHPLSNISRGRSTQACGHRWLAVVAPFTLGLAVLVVLVTSGLIGALAQDSTPGEASPAGESGASGVSDAQAQQRISEVNLVKLLAQRAALPFLRGDERFVLRESWWNGRIAPGESKLIQVQLFSRNAYQFWLAVPGRDAEVDLNLYDSEGSLVETETPEVEGANIVSLLAEPDRSGLYYLRIALREGASHEQEWGVIYAYR